MEKSESIILLGLSETKKKLFQLWSTHAETYRRALSICRGILNKDVHVKRGRVKDSELRSFPEIGLLLIEFRDNALKSINDMHEERAKQIIWQIEYIVEEKPYVYNSLKSFTCDSEWLSEKRPFSKGTRPYFNPDAASTGHKVRGTYK